jgi:plastocyanin
MSIHFYTITPPKNQRAAVTFILLITFVGSSPLCHYNALYAQVNTPPIFYQVRNLPSYVITIPFSSLGKSSFEPAEVNIPAGMTIIWFNDDIRKHSVTTLPSSPYLSHETIDSGPIPPNGGSFVHTFSKVGVYDYNDKFNPSIQGRIVVGISMVATKNMNMFIGGIGDIPFNPSHAQRVVLSFVPKTITIPPRIALTYQATISNAIRPWLIFTHKYNTSDGILDLELVPTHTISSPTNATTGFVTWGPDFRSQGVIKQTGTYHIKGPILVDPSEYDLRVAIVAKDNKILPNPIVSTFILLPKESTTTARNTS